MTVSLDSPRHAPVEASPPKRSGTLVLRGVLLILAALGAFSFWQLGTPPAPVVEPGAEVVPESGTPEPAGPAAELSAIPGEKTDSAVDEPASDDPRLKLAEGDWVSSFQGPRTLKLKSDGTGTMVSEPEGIAATLLAPKLTFEITWRLQGDDAVFETVSGTPKRAVDIVSGMYGSKRVHRILKLEQQEMILLDEDGETRYVWTRPPAADQQTSAGSADSSN